MGQHNAMRDSRLTIQLRFNIDFVQRIG